MKRAIHLPPADHDRVTAAVIAAESASDGEIATIIAAQSDDYADWALRWSLLLPLGWAAAMALWPHWIEGAAEFWTGGWQVQITPGQLIATALAGQIILFALVRLAFNWWPLRLAMTPRSVRAARVRDAAIRAFRIGTEQRTRAATGVLIYLSIAEHRAEIVADQSIHALVPEARWGDAMVTLLSAVRQERVADGICGAVEQVGAVIAEHFPRSSDDTNELPDRLVEL